METKVQIKAGVKSNSELMPGTWLVWLDAPEIAAVARAGQFVMVRCAESHDPLLRRPLSIHRIGNDGRVALLFEVRKTEGTFEAEPKGTRWLSKRVAGDLIDLVGPLGNGFSIKPAASSFLLIAGGIGIAPLVFLSDEASRLGKRVIVLLGARRSELLYPKKLLYPEDRLPSMIEVVSISDEGFNGRKGLVTDLIDECVDQADQVFACGPCNPYVNMYRPMAQLDCLKGRSVQVSLEERMACGMGACYGCTVKTRMGPKQVCHDGPVFELSDIVWQG